MFSAKQFREKAAEYVKLGKNTEASKEFHEFKALERSFTSLADNEEWLEHNFKNTVHAADQDEKDGDVLAAEEEHVLRCLGAAVIMQWNTIPKKLQRELFDNAGTMGDLLETTALRANIARFLHKHKDDER
jgi:hypothetical protein